MKQNITPFFATESDLAQLIDRIQTVRPLQFVTGGLSDLAAVHASPLLSKPDPASNYLVADRDLVIVVRGVPQRDGRRKYAIDQLVNRKTIALRPGGLIEKGCLVAGQLGTINEECTSLDLFEMFTSEMQRQFARVKSFYVGQEASNLLDMGVRLAANPRSPRLYDLTR